MKSARSFSLKKTEKKGQKSRGVKNFLEIYEKPMKSIAEDLSVFMFVGKPFALIQQISYNKYGFPRLSKVLVVYQMLRNN